MDIKHRNCRRSRTTPAATGLLVQAPVAVVKAIRVTKDADGAEDGRARLTSGFTLVELLVVIGIIALLVSILLPSLSKAREAARGVKCASNMRQMGIGLMMYADANQGFIPADGGDGTTSTPVTVVSPPGGAAIKLTWDSQALWFNAIPTYVNGGKSYSDLQDANTVPGLGDASIFICPSCDGVAATPADNSAGVGVSDNYFMLHGAPEGGGGAGDQVRPTLLCYVINSKLNATRAVQKLSQLTKSTSVALMVEKRMIQGELPSTDANYAKSLGQLKAEHKRFTGRHHRGGYITFADGHVDWFSNADLQISNPTNPSDFNVDGKVIWDPFGPAN